MLLSETQLSSRKPVLELFLEDKLINQWYTRYLVIVNDVPLLRALAARFRNLQLSLLKMLKLSFLRVLHTLCLILFNYFMTVHHNITIKSHLEIVYTDINVCLTSYMYHSRYIVSDPKFACGRDFCLMFILNLQIFGFILCQHAVCNVKAYLKVQFSPKTVHVNWNLMNFYKRN